MLECVKNLFGGEKKEKKSVSDVLFDLMFFVDTEAPKLVNSAKTEEDYVRKVLVPFNYILVPVTLGAKIYKTKEGELSLLFREYDLSEKEIQQLAYLADKLDEMSEEFYKNLDMSTTTDDITKIPARRDDIIFEKEISIKKIPEIVFGRNYNGLVSKRINGEIVLQLAQNGKKIAEAIKKKTMWIYGGVISTLLIVAATGGFFYYKKNSTEETTVENSDENIIDVESSEENSDTPYVETELN